MTKKSTATKVDTRARSDIADVGKPAAEWVDVSALVPWAANPRLNDGEPVSRVAESIKRFGFGAPIVARRENREIIAGHTRWKAAQALGMTQVPVRFLDIDEREAHLLALADNRLTELTEWDANLANVLGEFSLEEVALAGWNDSDLDKMAAELLRGEEVTEDEVPEAPLVAVTQLGDLYLLGRHRLVCGDSTQPDVVARCLDCATPFIMVTDPPYGVEYDPEWRSEFGDYGGNRPGVVENDTVVDWTEAYALFDGAVAYVWHAGVSAGVVAGNLSSTKLLIRTQIIWVKQKFVFGRGAYHWNHEPCWYAVRKGATSKWVGDRKQSTTWEIANANPMGGKQDDSDTVHSTQKPVECMARPIRNHGGKDDHVYDPFLGSGTTLIAAEQLGRTCFGIELSPQYCDVIVARWEKLTGLKAERVAA